MVEPKVMIATDCRDQTRDFRKLEWIDKPQYLILPDVRRSVPRRLDSSRLNTLGRMLSIRPDRLKMLVFKLLGLYLMILINVQISLTMLVHAVFVVQIDVDGKYPCHNVTRNWNCHGSVKVTGISGHSTSHWREHRTPTDGGDEETATTLGVSP